MNYQNEINSVDHPNLHPLISILQFYFSDSNLSKDRYLRHLLENAPDGYIDPLVLLSFSKVKELTEDVVVLLEASKQVQELERGIIKGKTFLRRLHNILPLKEQNTDERTIYIETIPANWTHEQITEKFEVFGKISYISLPKFDNGKGKGFTFIEFSTDEEAAQFLQLYQQSKEDALLSSTFSSSSWLKDYRCLSKVEWTIKKEEYKNWLKWKQWEWHKLGRPSNEFIKSEHIPYHPLTKKKESEIREILKLT